MQSKLKDYPLVLLSCGGARVTKRANVRAPVTQTAPKQVDAGYAAVSLIVIPASDAGSLIFSRARSSRFLTIEAA